MAFIYIILTTIRIRVVLFEAIKIDFAREEQILPYSRFLNQSFTF